MRNNSRDLLIAQGAAIVALLFALLGSFPSSYYVLLRFMVCVVCAYLAVTAYQRSRINWAWIFGAVAVLYNPVLPVRLQRDAWFAVYVTTITLMVLAIWSFMQQRARQEESVTSSAARAKVKHSFTYHLFVFFGFDPIPGTDLTRATEKPSIRECKCCGQTKITHFAAFVQNVSYLYERRERRFEGYVCLSCLTKTFALFETRTLFGTWWGIIGFFLGPFYLLWNLLQYLTCLYRFAAIKMASRRT